MFHFPIVFLKSCPEWRALCACKHKYEKTDDTKSSISTKTPQAYNSSTQHAYMHAWELRRHGSGRPAFPPETIRLERRESSPVGGALRTINDVESWWEMATREARPGTNSLLMSAHWKWLNVVRKTFRTLSLTYFAGLGGAEQGAI